jgi:hypothetical protein
MSEKVLDKTAEVEAVPPMDADKIVNAKVPGNKTYKLSRPVTIGGKTYTELNLDFESLTGEDLENVAKLPGCNSGDSNLNEFSKTYLSHVVALAAKITIFEVRKLPIKDWTALTMAAQIFLMGAVSETMEA